MRHGFTMPTLLVLMAAAGCAEAPSAPASVTPSSTPVRTPAAVAGEPAALAGITAAHNEVRARTGVPPLRWNPALADRARRWANACVDVEAPRGMLDHSPGDGAGNSGPVGENIYASTAATADPIVAVEVWAAEVAHYDHHRNRCSGGVCGHYTQLVWSTTRELGCGVGSCPRLRFSSTLVCNYSPAGNIVGQRPHP